MTMGWNDHVDWELMDNFDLLDEHDRLPEDSERCLAIVKAIAYGERMSAEDKAFYETHLEPLLSEIEEIRESDELQRLLDKDD